MLTSLLIRNLAVIKEVNIDFEKGFTVLTGETGAGKSILIDALFMILGERTSKDIIRHGEKSVFAEASFYIPDCENEILKEYLCDDTLIVSREIFCDGRNVVKINSRTANTGILKELAPYLVSIHSQNDNQILFNGDLHYKFLDSFGNTEELYGEYVSLYRKYTAVLKKIEEAKKKSEEDSGKLDYLKFVKEEIEKANITLEEEDELRDKKRAIKESANTQKAVNTAFYALFEGEGSATDKIGEAISALRRLDSMDEVVEKLEDIKYDISEASDEIQKIYDNINCEYADMDEIEDRLNEIYILKSKYGGSVESVLRRFEEAKRELEYSENIESNIEEYEKEKKETQNMLTVKASELSKLRERNGVLLSEAVENQLHDLMIPNAVFKVELIKQESFTPYGLETVRFLFSANAGMEPQPLNKIASGGEISRVNLAIKSILYNIDPACAFVFDEIDVGISGRAAQKTGEKMYELSQNNQILCVTHLPQIASLADNHLLITKNEDNQMTETGIKYIKDDDRTLEIARMTGGVEVTELTLKNAEETLMLAKKYREKIAEKRR